MSIRHRDSRSSLALGATTRSAAQPPSRPDASPPPRRGCRRRIRPAPHASSRRSPRASRATRARGACSASPTSGSKNLDGALTAYQRALEIDPALAADALQPRRGVRAEAGCRRGVRVARQGQGDSQARHDADRDRRGSRGAQERSALSRAAADTGGLRASVRRAGEDHPRVGRRSGQRSVRLDRAQHRRRRRRRRARHRDVGADQGHRRRDAGRVYVYSTKTGTLLWSVDGQPGDQLGDRRRGRRRHEPRRHSRCHRQRAGRRQRVRLLGQRRPRAADAHRREQGPTASAATSPASATSITTATPTSSSARRATAPAARRRPRVRVLGQGRPRAADADRRSGGRRVRQRGRRFHRARPDRFSSSARRRRREAHGPHLRLQGAVAHAGVRHRRRRDRQRARRDVPVDARRHQPRRRAGRLRLGLLERARRVRRPAASTSTPAPTAAVC